MSLNATSVDELPFVAGMLDAIGVDSSTECYEIAKAPTATAMSTTNINSSPVFVLCANDISSFEENIGVANSFSYGIVIISDQEKNILQIFGRGEDVVNNSLSTIPLESFFPKTYEEMYADGTESVAHYLSIAPQLSSINAVENKYDRIAAKNYAMTWSSEAPYSSTCPHNKHNIDLSKYNPAYSYYCHVDCANYVSQAMFAGGIQKTPTWQPGTAAWNGTVSMYNYFYVNNDYWYDSTYESCNAGGIITNLEEQPKHSTDWAHVNMCVMNDTVTRAYAAHNNDHSFCVYTDTYWDVPTSFFLIYYYTNSDIM